VVIGSFPTYFAKLLGASLTFYIRGLLMFGGVGALIAQAAFVQTHRMDLYRRSGRLSLALAPLVVLSGVVVLPEFAANNFEPSLA
jgi:hypothetical protein